MSKIKEFSLTLCLCALLLLCVGVKNAQAQYRKKVIAYTGQEAPGTGGAYFDQWNYPQAICIAESGKVLFRGYLEIGVAGVTQENDMGLWVYDADSLRLIAREGSPVPGAPGMLFRKESDVYLNGNMDRNGQVSLDAFYSPDGTAIDQEHGFFMEENSEMVLKLYQGLGVATGAAVIFFTAGAFNNGRVTFSCILEGSGVDLSNNTAYCLYGHEGIEILARHGEPMHLLTGGWTNGDISHYNDNMPLTADGETIFQITGSHPDLGSIGVVYKWDPVSDYSRVRVSEIGNATGDFGEWRMDSRGYFVSIPRPVWPNVFSISDHNDNLVVTSGDTAPGTGGATFSSFVSSFVAIDTMQVAFKARTSDYKFGIWMGDRSGLRKVLRPGDLAPGVPDSMRFEDVGPWIPNASGQFAITDLVRNQSTGSFTRGIWMFSPEGNTELVAVRDELIEVRLGDIRTVQYFYPGFHNIRSGADGYPSTLNNNGQLTYGVTFREGGNALVIASTGLVVNSTADSPDADTTDGVCDTGGPEVDGEPECTLRAALMEANASSGSDKISFDIPGSGIPVIRPETKLPTITDPVTIKGTTQSAGYVEIDGYNVVNNHGASGLTISTDHSEISGLLINRFTGAGITIENGDNNLLYDNIIGTDTSGTENRRNLFHGIHIIDSDNNVIGGESSEWGNTIAFNLSSGIYVESGQFNSFRYNRIYDNEKLGIDLAPDSVTVNDSLDLDSGANDLVNYPIIDSAVSIVVSIIDTLPPYDSTTMVYGTLNGAANSNCVVEIYYCDSCDPSGYGEGKRPVGSTEVTTNAEGVGTFFIQASQLLSNTQYITAIATDQLNNSSEFSECWPRDVWVRLSEGYYYDWPMKDQKFALAKVANDPPVFTEILIDTIVTNDSGLVNLRDQVMSGKLHRGDTIKFSLVWHIEPARKHVASIGSSYRKMLDNAKFGLAGNMYFDELEAGADTQKVIVDHASMVYNLLVSVEWEADLTYLNSLEQSFRNMTNYAYDVTDGQLRFDTIMILDARVGWTEADVQIHANNMLIPNAHVGGVKHHNGRIRLPRKWFGGKGRSRDSSFFEDPLDLSVSNQHRTMMHEFGHYAMSYYDEYIFPGGGSRCGAHPQRTNPYGFMDFQYESGGSKASEMSSESAYSVGGCRNTMQWTKDSASCWEQFTEVNDGWYSLIRVRFKSPSTRDLPPGLDYFPGPNTNFMSTGNLDYDVGSQVVFPQTHANNPAFRTRIISVTNPLTGTPFANTNVRTIRVSPFTSTDQGNTAPNGMIRALGATTGDMIAAHGISRWVSKSGGFSPQNDRWLFGEGAIGGTGISKLNNGYMSTASGDTTVIELKAVEGYLPTIPHVDLGDESSVVHLDILNSFQSIPELEHDDGTSSVVQYDFAADNGNYLVTVADSLVGSGRFTIWATDDSGHVFFFDTRYHGAESDSGNALELRASDGSALVALDSSNADIAKAMILSSPYPVIRTGLNELALQAGDAHSFSVYPDIALDGDNSIRILYADTDISNKAGSFDDETSLRIFRWDLTNKEWVLIGGIVDTGYNEVIASITETGVYAAFTTDIMSDVGDERGDIDNLPHLFELSQNYPNPFNPSTTISYTLPTRSDVTITVYNVLGQRVKRLVDGSKSIGHHSVTWNGKDDDGNPASSGVYFYRLVSNSQVESRKMVLMK